MCFNGISHLTQCQKYCSLCSVGVGNAGERFTPSIPHSVLQGWNLLRAQVASFLYQSLVGYSAAAHGLFPSQLIKYFI